MTGKRRALLLPEVIRLNDTGAVHAAGEVLLQDLKDGLDRGPRGAPHVQHRREALLAGLLPAKTETLLFRSVFIRTPMLIQGRVVRSMTVLGNLTKPRVILQPNLTKPRVILQPNLT